jgi:two-component system response regulator (stage 0 sporulation protein F)
MVARAIPPLVLVADDDDDVRSGIAGILILEGYEIVEACDGPHALELMARAADGSARTPDAVILDFVMPGLSGLGVLRVMRQFARFPPTIVVTAFPDPSVETFAKGVGALRVLRKPIEERDLREAVASALAYAVAPPKGREARRGK